MAKTARIPAVQTDAAASIKAPLPMVVIGHVDHGKSTLIGRLLHDTNSLPEKKYEEIEASCKRRGVAFEWAFVLDALQVERDQNVTIDTTRIWFKSAARGYQVIDAPGHQEFLRNMVTGAASAHVAVLMVDASEGMKDQTRRHAMLLPMLGVPHVIVAINKMDAVKYDAARFAELKQECEAFLEDIHITSLCVVPLSAREGENLAKSAEKMPWYQGVSLLAALDNVPEPTTDEKAPLRLFVQDVYRRDDKRIIVGRVETGEIKLGDEVLFLPANLASKVTGFEVWPESQKQTSAGAGESIAFTIADPLFIERGQLVAHREQAPWLVNRFSCRLFWLGQEPLSNGARYTIRLGTQEVFAEVVAVESVINTLSLRDTKAHKVHRNEIAEVSFRIKGLLAVDDHAALAAAGRFVVYDNHALVGGGIVALQGAENLRVSEKHVKSSNITAVDFEITPEERAQLNGHTGGILWFTGLSGSGKSTLAKELQNRLFAKGYQVYVLDGDNVRRGLCADLGFSPEERTENIRRVGEVAALFASAGFIVITAFISPYKEDRRRARAAAAEHFHTVYVKAGVDACEKRDVKGLYKKARAGEIKDFTGISAPYEPPSNPDLTINTESADISACVALLEAYVDEQFVKPVRQLIR